MVKNKNHKNERSNLLLYMCVCVCVDNAFFFFKELKWKLVLLYCMLFNFVLLGSSWCRHWFCLEVPG